MTTALEDRLTAALHARADLVQPETVRLLGVPDPATRPLWRRPVVVGLVAAAAVAAVAVPLVLRDHSHVRPQPANQILTPVPSLTGDVDGDGRPDQVRASGDTLTVTLAADPAKPLVAHVPHLIGLVGLANMGTRGHGILFAAGTNPSAGVDWSAYAVAGARLRPVGISFGGSGRRSFGTVLSVVPGQAVSWITPGGVPMSGSLDPSQSRERRLAVKVNRFVPRNGTLQQEPVGTWCWDRTTQHVPAPCPAGVSYAFHTGTHGSLPPLLPEVRPDVLLTAGVWRPGADRLRVVKAQPHTAFFKQKYDVVGTLDGRHVSAPIGTMAQLSETFVDLGHGVRGLAAQEGSSGRWNLLSVTDHGLVAASVAGPHRPYTLYPGTLGLMEDGQLRQADTWIGPGGRVFTRIETGVSGRYRVYRWQLADSSGTTVTPVDLGAVCIDDFQGTYGTCRS